MLSRFTTLFKEARCCSEARLNFLLKHRLIVMAEMHIFTSETLQDFEPPRQYAYISCPITPPDFARALYKCCIPEALHVQALRDTRNQTSLCDAGAQYNSGYLNVNIRYQCQVATAARSTEVTTGHCHHQNDDRRCFTEGVSSRTARG